MKAMKRSPFTLALAILTSLVLLAGCGGGNQQPDQKLTGVDWPMYGGTPSRINYTPENFAPPFDIKWSAVTGGLEGGAAVAGGVVCVADTEGRVWCMDAATGKEKWNFKGDGPFHDQVPLIYENRVYVTGDNGIFYCLDSLSGRKLWDKQLEEGKPSSPLGDGGSVYFSIGSKLYCFGARDGRQSFAYSGGDGVTLTAPALIKGMVYAGSDKGVMLCLNAADGSLVWSYDLGVEITCSPVLTEMRAFFGTADNMMQCLDRQTGQPLWSVRVQQKVSSTPAISGFDLIFGAGDNVNQAPGVVWCLDAVSGKERWRYETDYRSPLPLSASDAYVFVYGGLVLSKDAGSSVTSQQVSGSTYAPPAPYGGRIFICGADGTLYCMGP